MARTGVLWSLQREGEQLEAIVNERPSGECELDYYHDGTLLHVMWMTAGHVLNAIEEALEWRAALKASGWRECGMH